jgi:hypothetical protein
VTGLTETVSPEPSADRVNSRVTATLGLVTREDPADPDLAINQTIYTVIDPVTLQASRLYPLQESLNIEENESPAGFLTYNVVASVPARRPTATAASSCIDTWTIILPSPDIKTAKIKDPRDSALILALEHLQTLLNIWEGAKNRKSEMPPFQYEFSLDLLKKSEPALERRTGAWLILSHYDNGSLRMPFGNRIQSVGEDLKRELTPPGVVLLLACETAVPAPHSFLANLFDRGTTSALISTMAPLPGITAGEFVTAFIGVLGEAGPDGITVADAFRTALQRIPQETVPLFVLAGDPNVRLCAPPLVR